MLIKHCASGVLVLTMLCLVLPQQLCLAAIHARSASEQCTFKYPQFLDQYWNDQTREYMVDTAACKNPQCLYNVAEMMNPLVEAIARMAIEGGGLQPPSSNSSLGPFELLDQVAGILKNGKNGTVLVSDYFVPMGGSYSKQPLPHAPVPMWMVDSAPHNFETILCSAQFTFTVSKVLDLIATHTVAAASPPPSGDQNKPVRSSNMQQFIDAMSTLVTEHMVLRWVLSPGGSFQVHGWGCSGCEVPYNHSTYLRKKANWEFGQERGPRYCNAIQDVDMWVATSAMHLLSAHKQDPTVASIPDSYYEGIVNTTAALEEYVEMGVQAIESRIVTDAAKGTNNAVFAREGFSFDIGLWDLSPDNMYARYEGTTFPNTTDTTKDYHAINGTWDTSHGNRFIYVLLTLDRLSGKGTAWSTNLANQIAGRVMSQSTNSSWAGVCGASMSGPPLFSNFLNANGWYRVGYHGHGFGYGLHDDGNQAVFAAGYGHLSHKQSSTNNTSLQLGAAMECLHEIVQKTLSSNSTRENAAFHFLSQHYFTYWNDFQHAPSLWKVGTLDLQLRLFQFYSAQMNC